MGFSLNRLAPGARGDPPCVWPAADRQTATKTKQVTEKRCRAHPGSESRCRRSASGGPSGISGFCSCRKGLVALGPCNPQNISTRLRLRKT